VFKIAKPGDAASTKPVNPLAGINLVGAAEVAAPRSLTWRRWM
jgi:hypothetical protein